MRRRNDVRFNFQQQSYFFFYSPLFWRDSFMAGMFSCPCRYSVSNRRSKRHLHLLKDCISVSSERSTDPSRVLHFCDSFRLSKILLFIEEITQKDLMRVYNNHGNSFLTQYCFKMDQKNTMDLFYTIRKISSRLHSIILGASQVYAMDFPFLYVANLCFLYVLLCLCSGQV